LKRTITSIILITVGILSIFVLPIWTFGAVVSLFIGLGLYEFFRLSGAKKIFPLSFSYIGIFSGLLLPYITYLYRPTGGIWEMVFFILILITLFIIHFTRKESYFLYRMVSYISCQDKISGGWPQISGIPSSCHKGRGHRRLSCRI